MKNTCIDLSTDPGRQAMAARWSGIAATKGALILYGAGKFSLSLLELLERQGLRKPDVIWDDCPSTRNLLGIPVEMTPESFPAGVGTVVLGTDCMQHRMRRRLNALAGPRPHIVEAAPVTIAGRIRTIAGACARGIRDAAVRLLLPSPELILVRLSAMKNDAVGRAQLGEMFDLMRKSSHDNAAAVIRRRYDIHPSARWAFDTLIGGSGSISIGEGTYVGLRSHILADPSGASIRIGRNCAISHGVHIRTQGHHGCKTLEEERNLPIIGKDIVIGDDVWIGANVFIRGGISIGSNSIIGANSVVTSDIQPDSIHGGVPARLIRYKAGADSHC